LKFNIWNRKRKKLPRNFEKLLEEGDISKLKEVFKKCELSARAGYSEQTALAFNTCPHELAMCLVEKGLDINAIDRFGHTALQRRSKFSDGNIISLLQLGADPNYVTSRVGTSLHAAAVSHRVDNTKFLIEFGARIDELDHYDNTPLEVTLKSCQNVDILNTLEISKILIGEGAKVTSRSKEYVSRIGEEFEFYRNEFNKELVLDVSNGLNKLYELFQVNPVSQRDVHDGVSLILIPQMYSFEEKQQYLWDLLVPSKGHARTVQGEVIRISGRVHYELEHNGGINWDQQYRMMTKAFYNFIKTGNALARYKIMEINKIVKSRNKFKNTYLMCELAVEWVEKNPEPITLTSVDYSR